MTRAAALLLCLMYGAAFASAHAQGPGRFRFGAVWVAESLDGVRFAQTSRPTLQIMADGQVSGNAGCNRYRGTLATIDGAKMQLEPLAMTRMACFGAGGANEQMFAPAISTVTGWRMERRTLVLETENGPLRFRRR